MSDDVIYPTGTCFDDAVHNMAEYARQTSAEQAHKDLVIVHAILEDEDGDQMAHAWIEIPETGMLVFDGIVNGERTTVACRISEYYEKTTIVDSTRYTIQEAVEADRKERTGGPWLEKYKRLTKEGKKRERNKGN